MINLQRPGLWTDRDDPGKNLGDLRALGFEWLAFQLQNEDNPITDRTAGVALARSKGLAPVAWGQSGSTLGAHTRRLVTAAMEQRCEALWMAVERPIAPGEALMMVAEGQRFSGPKALVTFTAYIDQVQHGIFLDAGWHIAHEAYVSDQTTTTPLEGERRRIAANIPVGRFSHLLSMYRGDNGLPTGVQWASMLKSAAAENRFSCWMVEHEFDDYGALAQAITPASTPAPVPPPPATVPSNAEVAAAKDLMRKNIDEAGEAGMAIVRRWRAAKVSETVIEQTKISKSIAKLVEARNALE